MSWKAYFSSCYLHKKKNLSKKLPIAFTTQFVINHSLDLGMVLYIFCEFLFAKTLAPNCHSI
jgi:hypothetical protein